MNHLEATFKGKNRFWRYLIMFPAVFIASNTIGALPLLTGLLLKSFSNPSALSLFSGNDYSLLGFSPNTLLIVMLFPFIAGLAAFIVLVKPLHGRTFMDVINGTPKFRWNRFFISLLIWLGLSVIYFVFYLKLDPHNFTVNNTSVTVITLAVITILLIPFQASFEEILFRGYLMQGFAALMGKRWFPLIMTSVLFALMHGLNPEVKEYGFLKMMPQYILFGMIFGIITILDDGVEAAIGAHTANNAFLCIMVTSNSSALQTAALFEQHKLYPWIELGALMVIGLMFIFILKVIFRWKSFALIFSDVKKPEISEPVN